MAIDRNRNIQTISHGALSVNVVIANTLGWSDDDVDYAARVLWDIAQGIQERVARRERNELRKKKRIHGKAG